MDTTDAPGLAAVRSVRHGEARAARPPRAPRGLAPPRPPHRGRDWRIEVDHHRGAACRTPAVRLGTSPTLAQEP